MIPLDNCKPLGQKIDEYLVKWRTERESEHKESPAFAGYQRGSYILKAKVPRFGSGEGKGVVEEATGEDIKTLVKLDVVDGKVVADSLL